jgi:hypothetical protein
MPARTRQGKAQIAWNNPAARAVRDAKETNFMIRKLIGAAVGASLAKRNPAAGGVTGAMLASAVPFVLSRISLPAMAAIGVGGYLAKRYMDKRDAQPAPAPTPASTPAPPQA